VQSTQELYPDGVTSVAKDRRKRQFAIPRPWKLSKPARVWTMKDLEAGQDERIEALHTDGMKPGEIAVELGLHRQQFIGE